MVITESIVTEIIAELKAEKGLDCYKVRQIVNSKVAIGDTIPVKLWPVMFKLRHRMYNPADTGITGKETEVRDRLTLWRDCGVAETTWKEFSAHAADNADITDPDNGEQWDIKTTVSGGDFLTSDFAHTPDEIITEYRNRSDFVCYKNTEYQFSIYCKWHELLSYLESYNEKGLATWLRTDKVRYNPSTGKYVLCMQVVKTSGKKLAYLRAWKGEQR